MFLGAFLTFYVPERVCLVHNSASETLENTVGFQLFQVVAILCIFFHILSYLFVLVTAKLRALPHSDCRGNLN